MDFFFLSLSPADSSSYLLLTIISVLRRESEGGEEENQRKRRKRECYLELRRHICQQGFWACVLCPTTECSLKKGEKEDSIVCVADDSVELLIVSSAPFLLCVSFMFLVQVGEGQSKGSMQRILDLSPHGNTVTTVDWSPSIDTPVCLTGARDGHIKVATLLSQ